MNTIHCERMDLELLSANFLEALMGGRRTEAQTLVPFPLPAAWPGAHEHHFRMRLDQMRKNPATEGWLVRAMVLRGPTPLAVGRIGFHGPPGVNGKRDPGALEVGYDVDPVHRRKGYASEAARALISWASAEHGIRRFLASVSPGNEPSLAIVRKLGFVQIGTQWDEDDGEELVVFELSR